MNKLIGILCTKFVYIFGFITMFTELDKVQNCSLFVSILETAPFDLNWVHKQHRETK